MRIDLVSDLAQCGELRQTLQQRPPRFVHATALILTAFLAGMVLWGAVTDADLVVRGAARVRPAGASFDRFGDENRETVRAGVGGRVARILVEDGAAVRAGDALAVLDTGRLDNDLAALSRRIATAREEVEATRRMELLLDGELEATRLRFAAELAQAATLRRGSSERRDAEIRLARLELEAAGAEERRLRTLAEGGAAADADLARAAARVAQAEARLAAVSATAEDGRLEVLRRQEIQATRELEARREELRTRRLVKGGEIEALERERANLELEREQATIRAQTDGVATLGGLDVGDLVERGAPIAAITERDGFRVDAVISVADVARVRPGMPARVRLDAYDHQEYGVLTGWIERISDDALLVDLPGGRQTRTYVVSIALERQEIGRGGTVGALKLGMTGQVEIVTGTEPMLSLFVRKVRQSVSIR